MAQEVSPAQDAISELSALPQWVLWRRLPPLAGQTKPRKVPFAAATLEPTSVTDPNGWSDALTVMDAYDPARDGGVGFVFTLHDPYVGIDLDGCRNAETGAIEEWALAVVKQIDSYTEISPSGTGVHILARGKLPPVGRHRGRVEIYEDARFFTVTTQHLDGTPTAIMDRREEICAFHAATFPAHESKPAPALEPLRLDDRDLLDRMFASANGAKFVRLWSGDTSDFGDDDSSADLSLCDGLAWWTNSNPAQMDRLFRTSGLMRPKWNERRGALTYGERTIRVAIEGATGGYSGRKAAPLPAIAAISLNGDTPLSAMQILGPTVNPRWPDPPDERVYHGIAGEFVRLIDPHTEADPMAILMQFLVSYGNAIGRSAHFVAEADRHYANLYTCLVGETAKGRKGSSLGQVRRVMAAVVPEWADFRIQEGQSSGEGLIWAVRDPIHKKVAVTNKGKATGEYRDEMVDEGVADKRLLAAESEFASLLRVLEREGNTLSAVLRQAWDSGTLRALTKNSQAKATGAHISEIGHITADELHRYLMRTEVANGLGNRFLWLCVRRSKVLPDGGNIGTVDFGQFCRDLATAIDFGSTRGEMARDGPARNLWHQVYPDLSEGKPGMAGALTARAEAQVMRLAMVYALLDLSPVIAEPHLSAALALWRYCDASVRAVFGDAVGDPIADTILAALREAPEGMNRTQVYKLFHGNRDGEQLGRALTLLEAKGMIETIRHATGGRPTEVVRLRSGTEKV